MIFSSCCSFPLFRCSFTLAVEAVFWYSGWRGALVTPGLGAWASVISR